MALCVTAASWLAAWVAALALSGVQAPVNPQAESELRNGTELTRQGQFRDAIPHLLAARGAREEYAVEFNLALCYVGTQQPREAIGVLQALRAGGHDTPAVGNLLAQALIADARPEEAWREVARSAARDPQNEKLYLFVADAASDRRDYELGLRVAALGLTHLPDSARLHYQKGHFLAFLDRLDEGKGEFERAAALAPGTELSALARVQEHFHSGELAEAIAAARAAVREGRANDLVLALLGDALLRAGAVPGQPEFAEAETALLGSLARKPRSAAAQVSLGYLLLLKGRPEEALAHLETARELDPENPAAYRHLAAAYRKLGDPKRTEAMLSELARLNAQQAERIYASPGERKPVP